MPEYKDAAAIKKAINKEIEERCALANPLGNGYGTGYINGLTKALLMIRALPAVWVDVSAAMETGGGDHG